MEKLNKNMKSLNLTIKEVQDAFNTYKVYCENAGRTHITLDENKEVLLSKLRQRGYNFKDFNTSYPEPDTIQIEFCIREIPFWRFKFIFKDNKNLNMITRKISFYCKPKNEKDYCEIYHFKGDNPHPNTINFLFYTKVCDTLREIEYHPCIAYFKATRDTNEIYKKHILPIFIKEYLKYYLKREK